MRGLGDFKDIDALKAEEIIDFLVGFGERLNVGTNTHLQRARELYMVVCQLTYINPKICSTPTTV